MDRWTREDIDELVSLGGNKGNARFWNPKNVPFPFDGDDDKAIVEHYIRDKYILGKFRYDEIKPEDFGSRMDDFDGESDRFDERNRSRSRSRSHSFYKGGHNRSDYGGSRDSFQSSGSRYSRQLAELKDMGFGDTNKNLDALSSAHGNINRAIDYLEKSSSSRNSVSAAATTSTPPLPRRRATTSGPQPAIFDGTNVITPDFTSNSASFVQAKPAVFDGTLQQYYDPATGMIYVDQQQYAMAMQQQQQQQQQLAVAQAQAQAQAQQIQMQQLQMQQQQQAPLSFQQQAPLSFQQMSQGGNLPQGYFYTQ